MPKAGNHFIMSVLDAMGCDRTEDIFNFGEGSDGAISVGWGHLPSEAKASKPCSIDIFGWV